MYPLAWWKQMDWWFFLSLDSANEEFLYKYSLSQKPSSYPSLGTPIILNLYLNEPIKFITIRNATNSFPKFELSNIFCLLEYQIIGSELQYKIISVWDFQVALSPAWSKPTTKLTWTGFTIGFGEFYGIYSPSSTYKSLIAWTLLWIFWSLATHW